MNNIRNKIALIFSCMAILSCRIFAQEASRVETSSEPAQCVLDKDIVTLEKKVSALNTAVADINKKYSELRVDFDTLRAKLNALSVENENAKLSAKKSRESDNAFDDRIKEQGGRIDELATQLRLAERTISNLQERQSVGEYSIKKDYGREVERSVRSSKFMNILAISAALIAVIVAL